MTRVRPAEVRVFCDQDLRGLGIVLGGLRADFTYPSDPGDTIHKRLRPPCPVTVGTLDTDWLPVAGKRRWLVLSRDRQIQESLSELSAVRQYSVKMVCLTGESSANKWVQLEAVMSYWRRLQGLAEREGPYVFKLSRKSGLREVNIDEALERLRNGRKSHFSRP